MYDEITKLREKAKLEKLEKTRKYHRDYKKKTYCKEENTKALRKYRERNREKYREYQKEYQRKFREENPDYYKKYYKSKK